MEAHCASGTAVSPGARPCSDVRSAASKRAAYLRMCASKKSAAACALSLSREEAQHARLRLARAPPRWLESVYTLRKPTVLAGRPSPSVHDRALTCESRPPTSSLLALVRKQKQPKPRVLSLSLGRKRCTRVCNVRTPRRAGSSRPMPYGRPLCHRNGCLLPRTAVLRRASPGLQRAAYLHMCASKKSATARTLSLSQEEAQHARLRRSRASPRWLESARTL